MKTLTKLAAIIVISGLASCSSNIFNQGGGSSASGTSGTTGSGAPVGGSMRSAMDEIDQSKLSHALDNGLGKPTHWQNPTTGIAYTVTPVEKTTVGGNELCRRYTIVAERAGQTENYNGTACVGTDGNWVAQ